MHGHPDLDTERNEDEDGAVPASPCIRVCKLGEDRACIGCLRTIHEIAAWPFMTPAEKRDLIEKLDQRRSKSS